MLDRPVLSICCITFNHAAYIGQAIEGFLAQRTDFPLEIIIHDDASTDGTADIVREYERRFPELIRGIYQTENQYKLEKGRVTRIIRSAARGEFIALCEGDDYWIDPEKSQLQVDQLREVPELSFCFTNAYNEYDGNRREDYVRGWLGSNIPRERMTQKNIVAKNFIPTAGVVYRRDRLDRFTEAQRTILALDWLLHVALSSTGPFIFLDRISAVRRVHEGGVISKKNLLTKIDQNFTVLKEIEVLTRSGYPDIIGHRRAELFTMAIQHCVDGGEPSIGKRYLNRLLKDTMARKATNTKVVLRFIVQTYLPRMATIILRLRTGSQKI